MFWINQPQEFQLSDETLTLTTQPKTDFWQKTHYPAYQANNGHAYLQQIEGDFVFSCKTQAVYKHLYDQSGVLLHIDSENWVKASFEYHDENYGTLGSVITSFGYSDWAFQNHAPLNTVYYKITKKGKDLQLEYSFDGQTYQLNRICHLHSDQMPSIGVYACSPQESSFECVFSEMKINKL